MDFDLFELDEDDEILSSLYLEPTQHLDVQFTATTVLPEFHCKGSDELKSQFSADGFVRNGFTANLQQGNAVLMDIVTLTSYDFQIEQIQCKSIEEFIFGEACMNIQYLMASVKGQIGAYDELTYYQRRRQVTQLLHLLLQRTKPQQWPKLQQQVTNLRNLLNCITEAETWKLIYFANSCKGNECQVPAYHFLHGSLEWKLLDVFIMQKFAAMESDIKSYNAKFKLQLERIFQDLLTCSLLYFAKKRSVELLQSSAFPCTCFKEFWLILQLVLPKWAQENQLENGGFWEIFNSCIEKLKAHFDFFSLDQVSFCEFQNWMIYALSRLHGFRSNGMFEGPQYMRAITEESENYTLLESCTQQFLSSNPNEERARVYICILMPTLLQWWKPKVNIVQLFWEHFHKRLNSSFFIAGTAPSNLAVACVSGKNYLTKYRQLLAKEGQPDANLSSYTLFVLFLGKTLERLIEAQLGNQAQKLLGRIYAKFSLQKFFALSETGIHHLIELFLVLALTGDFGDLAPKLRDKLLSIAFDKVATPKQIAVAKGHMALLILFAANSYDISIYVTKLLGQLQAVRNDLAVSKIIADALLDIYEYADDFKRGEAQLIDAWLPNFLNNCTPSEQERSLEALHLIFVKIQQSSIDLRGEQQVEILKALTTHILPFLKQQYVTNYSNWFPQLAADFCIYASTKELPNSFERLFHFFAPAQTANRQALPKFLLKILESEKRTLVEASIIMHVWLKSLVLLTAVNEDVAKLTKIVVQLPEFQQVTQLDPIDLMTAKEPLCVFIAAVGKKYENCVEFQQRCKIADALNEYLRNFEKWLQLDFKQEKSELAFRFYSFIAIVIYNCAPLVYTKSKISCFFHVAMTRYVLPTSIQMGKPPEDKLAQLIHKIWPVLVQGIGRLYFKTDPYITKTLTDLIQKWTPHFKISPNSKVVARPFITCLQADNHELSLFIFEKLTSLFLVTQRRQADPNACLVITIYQEIVEAISTATEEPKNEKRLATLLKGSSLLMLEHIMMVDEVVPSRALLLELFKRIILSAVFQSSVTLKELLCEHLRIITKRHLAYYTFFYFELLLKIAQISYSLIEEIMPFLLDEVRVVEQKRGAGEDNRIRGCLHKLQQTIAAAKSNSGTYALN